MMKRSIIFFIAISFTAVLWGQRRITLQDIWQSGDLFARSVPGFNFQNDGVHYTRLERNKIEQYDLTTGKLIGTLFDPGLYAGENKYFNR